EADKLDVGASPPYSPDAITPRYVLSSPLDGTSVSLPDVVVNQDSNAASQNEPAIAVDPSNPNRIVVAMNDYVSRTWSCAIAGTPCSALGDGYSGTYFSNDRGMTWCCTPTDPAHLGTMIPGVERLTGGIYDAGGDPRLAFGSAQRAGRAGFADCRGRARDGLRLLGWDHPLRRVRQHLDGRLHGRRSFVQLARRCGSSHRYRPSCEHGVPREQLSGGGRRTGRDLVRRVVLRGDERDKLRR